MTEPLSAAVALTAPAVSLQYNRVRLDALGSLGADRNGVTTHGGGNFLNNSGGTRSSGDVVIQDTSADDRFTTTTLIGDFRVIGVVVDSSIANAVRGTVQTRGPVTMNVTGTVLRGEYLVTSGTGGQAQSNGSGIHPGVFAVALEASSGGTVVALLFGSAVFATPYNYLTNPGFEVWQRGTSFNANGYTADRWKLSLGAGSAASVAREGTLIDIESTYALSISYTQSNASVIDQEVEVNGPGLKGRPLTFSVRAKGQAAITSGLSLSLIDVDGSTVLGTVGPFSLTTSYQTFSVTGTPAATTAAGKLICRITMSVTGVYDFDNASLVLGTVAWDNAPLALAEEWLRCFRYYQRWGASLPAATQVGVGQATSTTVAQIALALRTMMGGSPTLSVSANSDWALTNAANAQTACSALALQTNALGHALAITATVGSAVLVAGNATQLQAVNTSAWIAAEWNP